MNAPPSKPSASTTQKDGADSLYSRGFISRIHWLWKQKATRIGCLLTAAIGAFLIWQGSGILARFSYDVRSVFQRNPPSELVMVRIDSEVKRNLNQPTDQPLNRRF